jgi:hypothetical protein
MRLFGPQPQVQWIWQEMIEDEQTTSAVRLHMFAFTEITEPKVWLSKLGGRHGKECPPFNASHLHSHR